MWAKSEYEEAFEVLQRLETQFRVMAKAIEANDQDSLERVFRLAYSKIYHYMEPDSILQLIEEIADILEKYTRRN